MASNDAVATALKMLGRAFAGVVDEAKIEVYHAALEDLNDEMVRHAAVVLIKTHPGEFIPTPAAIRTVAGANIAPVVDAGAVIRRIEKLAVYNPSVGMIYPHVQIVRDHLGDAIGAAYAAAGGARVFSENDTTRSIAEREFQSSLAESTASGVIPTIIGAAPARPLLGS